jgi:excisionase family DNA binding protein
MEVEVKNVTVNENSPVMSIKEAAKYFKVGITTMYEIAARRDFNALIQVGCKKLVHRRKFDEWIEKQVETA